MIHLLDVSVLIALLDTRHVQHENAHRWFAERGRRGFATCPIVENGALRILGNPRYAGSPGSPAAVIPSLNSLRAIGDHSFWPDELSLLDSPHVDAAKLGAAGQVTDTYLLALAVSRGGRLATLDRKLGTGAVVGGAAALDVIA
ncbi:MAG: VapC toxin family PIN domain ribonuclease [Phenylobacterium sp.]|uniref:TA system VapC family ribonuclease toxin n=1 Tax=Phenylobacterium sp. TaxID=1871053 RepID=UPI001A4EA102|nr:TA system VapC family ribonuclease toxin [Phenylobacterium sp.]MBL8553946.1 VapC toxin family PIN domain ribonuclease [Phenylobacterium sp.]